MSKRVEDADGLDAESARHILVALDTSPASQAGLRAAARLAQRTGARVTVVYVRHPEGLSTFALYPSGAAAEELLNALDALEKETRSDAVEVFAGTGVPWDFQVRRGSPGIEILRAVDELGADLVVIGSQRHSPVHNVVIGSTTAYVTANSPVPVVVVRPVDGVQSKDVAVSGQRDA